MLVLDTDHVSVMEWSEGSAQQNLLRLNAIPPDDVFTTIVTYEEQTRGWMAYAARARTTAQQIEAYRKLERHLDLYRHSQVLGFGKRAGAAFDHLRGLRLRIGAMDLKIAAIHCTRSRCNCANKEPQGLQPCARLARRRLDSVRMNAASISLRRANRREVKHYVESF